MDDDEHAPYQPFVERNVVAGRSMPHILRVCLSAGVAVFIVACLPQKQRDLNTSGAATELSLAAIVDSSLLDGAAPCEWSTGGAFYRYPFNAYFASSQGDYGWEVTIANGQKDQEVRNGELRFHRGYDVYDQPYASIDDSLEVGWAVWLRPPEVRLDAKRPEWTSRAFVGTRISTATHTFCGCQFMRGDATKFHLTEHGRAQLQFEPPKAGVPWYANLTRRQINSMIEATCRPLALSTVCPADNETAYDEWATRIKNGTYWTLQPWVETYRHLPRARG